MRAGLVLLSALATAMTQSAPSLKQAAVLYHQGRYDSALSVLATCRSTALKHRDSLALFQYSGMAFARLGKGQEADADFRALLDLDSLFQFPRNEDSAILSAFAKARDARARAASKSIDSASDQDSLTEAADEAKSETAAATALPVSAPLPEAQFVPIPSYPATSPKGSSLAPSGIRGKTGNEGPPGIGLAMGAIPLGGGWLLRGHRKQGLALALLQAGGLGFSMYASSQMIGKDDPDGIRHGELGNELRWQWTQRVTLSIALGAYLFSLIASKGE